MPIARLQAKFGNSAIDAEAGIIRGVKVMQNGALARFAGDDGKAKQVTISPAHIAALMAHAGNRSIPSHLSHDWFGSDNDAIHSRIGALKNFSVDSTGNLIADLHLAPGSYRDTALWNAAEAPENMMLSAVFSYGKDDAKCLPLDFQACDIVAQGAATTALFSADDSTNQPKQPMDISELIAALSDPAVKTALKAVLDSHEEPDGDEAAAAATMEADAGVTDADKAPEDEQKPALMRAALRIARVTKRTLGEIKAERTAILAEADLKSQANATALLGNSGKFAVQSDADKSKDEIESAIAAQITAGAKDRATAIFRIAKDKPEIYNTARAAGRI